MISAQNVTSMYGTTESIIISARKNELVTDGFVIENDNGKYVCYLFHLISPIFFLFLILLLFFFYFPLKVRLQFCPIGNKHTVERE